ncbi:MAG: YgfZ/GcvT domain-containing protein [Burkholderiaceae bacterium]
MSSPAPSFEMPLPHFDLEHFNGAAQLNHLGLIECMGVDAEQFLHQQLTQDMVVLPPGSSTLAGFCNSKGRLQASMVVIKESSERFLLILQMDLLERTLKRLSMFVLRAKLKMRDVSASHSLVGLMGKCAELPVSSRPSSLQAPLQSALGLSRKLLCLPHASPMDEVQALLQTNPLSPEHWALSDVLSGVAWVQEKTFEQFVPQMLNYESAAAVSFKKGCYPGQEVVARSQFRGSLKRRTVIVFGKEALSVGMELFGPLHAAQPCAVLAQVARHEGFFFALACFQIEALPMAHDKSDQAASLRAFLKLEPFGCKTFCLEANSSQPIELGFWPLPYALLEDI